MGRVLCEFGLSTSHVATPTPPHMATPTPPHVATPTPPHIQSQHKEPNTALSGKYVSVCACVCMCKSHCILSPALDLGEVTAWSVCGALWRYSAETSPRQTYSSSRST